MIGRAVGVAPVGQLRLDVDELETRVADLRTTKGDLEDQVDALKADAVSCQLAVDAAQQQLALWDAYLDNFQVLATTTSDAEADALLQTMSVQYRQLVERRSAVDAAIAACG